MPVSSASQVAARMQKVADAVRKSQVDAARKASIALKAGVQSTSPSRLRNVGKSGARLGVSFTVTGGAVPESKGRATGPWAIIEYDTPVHLIGIGKSGRKRARVRVVGGEAVGGYLKAPGYAHGVTGPIVHPGTKGKLVFHKGIARGTPKAVAAMRKQTVEAVKGAWS